jgi:hypothetical protein
MMQKEFYYKPSHLKNIIGQEHYEEAKAAQYETFVLEKHTGKKPSTYQAPTSFEQSKFMDDLRKEFKDVRTNYLKFDPMTCYDWHVDAARNCSINFLLNDVPESLTLFREYIEDSRHWYNIKRLKYNLYQPTLLNVKEQHCVINYSQETRYVLTIGFTLDVSYMNVKRFLMFYKNS